MKKILLFVVFMAFTRICYADVCVTIDTSLWTNEQKAMMKAAAYRLAFEAGQNTVPSVSGNNICFPNPTFDVPSTITELAILNRIAKQLSDNAVAISDEESVKNLIKNELSSIDSQLETDDAAWSTLTTNQKIAVMKKVLRREVLRQKLGQ